MEKESLWKMKIEVTKFDWFMAGVLFVLITFLILIIGLSMKNYELTRTPDYDGNLSTLKVNRSIEFLNLNEKEIENINLVLSDLKPEYLELYEQIVFIKNWESIKNTSYEHYKSLDVLNFTKEEVNLFTEIRGLNLNGGERIYVVYNKNLCSIRNTICHELCHSLISLKEIDEEWFVIDITKYNVCYKNKFCEENEVFDKIIINSSGGIKW